eukprot:11226226-Lingulodinium_polyedra.AAC.1
MQQWDHGRPGPARGRHSFTAMSAREKGPGVQGPLPRPRPAAFAGDAAPIASHERPLAAGGGGASCGMVRCGTVPTSS